MKSNPCDTELHQDGLSKREHRQTAGSRLGHLSVGQSDFGGFRRYFIIALKALALLMLLSQFICHVCAPHNLDGKSKPVSPPLRKEEPRFIK